MTHNQSPRRRVKIGKRLKFGKQVNVTEIWRVTSSFVLYTSSLAAAWRADLSFKILRKNFSARPKEYICYKAGRSQISFFFFLEMAKPVYLNPVVQNDLCVFQRCFSATFSPKKPKYIYCRFLGTNEFWAMKDFRSLKAATTFSIFNFIHMYSKIIYKKTKFYTRYTSFRSLITKIPTSCTLNFIFHILLYIIPLTDV